MPAVESRELIKIQQIVNSLIANSSDENSQPERRFHEWADPGDPSSSAKALYRFRRKRELLFDSMLFGEPAWDLLLDLYEATVLDRKISVTSGCIASAVPSTTALRWISILLERGLIERYPDPRDARRTFIRLTPDALSKMEELFSG